MTFTTADIDRLTGSTVRSTDDDKIGSIGQVYVDSDSTPTWATVKTGLFGSSESFVPLDHADFAGKDVRIPFTKDIVKDAPRIAADGELDDAETDRLYDYYEGRRSGAGKGGSSDPVPSTTQQTTGRRPQTTKSHEGHDTSGPTTDDAMTRSEERLKVGVEQLASGRARLRKHIVTEQQTVTVPVTHERATMTREPITEADIADATSGPTLSEEEHEVVLHDEQVVTSKDTVPVERVRLGTEQVTENRQVTEDVRKEEIDSVDSIATKRK